jgi:preprotein translocase subunit SecG
VLLCLSKLLVMSRFSAFVLRNSRLQLSSTSHPIVERISFWTFGVTSLAGSVSAVSGWISAYHSGAAGAFYANAADNTRIFGHNSSEVNACVGAAISNSNAARLAASVQLSAETVTLIIIIVLSITCGLIAFILVQRATNLLLDSSSDPNAPIVAAVSTGAGVKQRIQRTVVVVFSGFLIRSSFDLLYSVCLTADRAAGVGPTCDPQQSTYFLISKTLDYSPYIQASVVFISEPLVLVVALWGMITPRMRYLFASAFPHSDRSKSRL